MKKLIIMVTMLLLILGLYIQPVPAAEYDSQNIQQVSIKQLGEYRVTFYCNCSSCCGEWAGGPTALGVYPIAEHTCACGSDIPFGTILYIEGLGIYVCQDRGVGQGCIDVFVNNHGQIPEWGMAYINTYMIY